MLYNYCIFSHFFSILTNKSSLGFPLSRHVYLIADPNQTNNSTNDNSVTTYDLFCLARTHGDARNI